MTILFTVNLIPTAVAQKLGLSSDVWGGWVESMLAALKKIEGVQLFAACKSEENQIFDEIIDGVEYFSLPYVNGDLNQHLERRMNEIIAKVRPDIVHIEGTEFPHSRIAMSVAEKNGIPAVVSLQGILNGQYNYQCGQLQIDDMIFSRSLTNIYAGWILHLRKTRWYKKRMPAEREVIEKAKYILGRTTWDRAHAYAINPDAKYYSVSRILRQPFYERRRDESSIEKHSLYVGNAYYALKGFHFLADALPQLIREYPDIKVYVAGVCPFGKGASKSPLKRGYGAFLKKKIKDLGIGDHIVFTGKLSAAEVAERLSKTHVYVLSSAIENSPNTLGEAMMVGVPCVSAYAGGAPDMAIDEVEALFYRNDDPALLAWQIKRIFDSDDLARSLSENGRQRALDTHSKEKNAEKLYGCYKDILSSLREK